MADDGISAEVKAFIREHIASVEQLEVLLLLFRDPAKEWDAASLSKELYISPESAASRLDDFHARNLAARTGDPAPKYRYKPNGAVADRVIRDLATTYELRRVRVINEIFSNPIDNLRSFADAFKFKKNEE